MEGAVKVIEMTGIVDEHHQLQLDGSLPVPGPVRVRILVLYPLSDEDEREETEWFRAAVHNPAFAFLNDPVEDIYSLSDGEAFHDEV